MNTMTTPTKPSFTTWITCAALFLACGGEIVDESDANVPDDAAVEANPTNKDSGAVVDGAVSNDASSDADGPPLPEPILCGPSSCNSLTQICCVTVADNDANYACLSPLDTCDGYIFECSDQSACLARGSDWHCCVATKQSFDGAECNPSDVTCPTPTLCATSAECPQGQSCEDAMYGYKTCQ